MKGMDLAVATAAKLPVSATRVSGGSRARATVARLKWWRSVGLAAILAMGIFLRVFPSTGYHRVGFDEHAYTVFLEQIKRAGILNYDAVVQVYLERQAREHNALVPATRVGFLVPAYAIGKLFHLPPFVALCLLNGAAGILTLAVTALLCYRAGGTKVMLGVTALFATAPLQIYLSQRALIDGYFASLALVAFWLLLENLQRPRSVPLLLAYSFCLLVLVLTKENSAFVIAALVCVLLSSYWLRPGSVSPELLAATVIGPILALLVLIALVGGVGKWVEFYQMFIAKSRTNIYCLSMQDGPWYRYLVDWLLLSPVIVALAFGGIFQLRKSNPTDICMALFLGASFISMSLVRYGMSLRFAGYWELPLCWLAFSQLDILSHKLKRQSVAVAALVAVLALINLSQYHRVFIAGAVYDPVSGSLVRALQLEKRAR